MLQFYTRLLMEVKGRMDKGENLECFAARLWEDNTKNQLDLTTLAYGLYISSEARSVTDLRFTVAGSAFEAGTDNTAGTILWFIVAGLLNPDVLKRGQEELDRVLGADGYTAPSFHHLDQLPYCVAIVKETFRLVSFHNNDSDSERVPQMDACRASICAAPQSPG